MCTVGTDQGVFFWGHVLEEGTWTRSSLHAIVQPGSRSYIWALYIEQESSLPYSYQYCRQIGLVDLICVQWSINTSASGMWWEKDEYCGSANMWGSSLATRKKRERILWPSFLASQILASFGHPFAHVIHELSGTPDSHAVSQGRGALLRHLCPFAGSAAPESGCRMSGRVFFFVYKIDSTCI